MEGWVLALYRQSSYRSCQLTDSWGACAFFYKLTRTDVQNAALPFADVQKHPGSGEGKM
jgi:hypothetical protein